MTNLISGETLRVLLVGEYEDVRDQVSDVLADQADDHRLYWVSQPELAVGRAQDLVPHLILVDDELGGVNPARLIQQLVAQMPSAVVLALLYEDGMGVARQAMLAGARGFIIKPLHPVEFMETLQQTLGRGQSGPADHRNGTDPALGQILVWCAPKGGTGRTTTAVNTAISLHQMTNKSLVLVDADYSSPALDVALNLHEERNITDLLPRLSRLDRELLDGVLATHTSGIQVLLAPPPAQFTAPISLPQVEQLVAQLKRMYGWVVVDLGLPLDEMAFGFLDSADRIVMSVLPEMVGLRNTRLMLDQLRERGYPEEKIWLVLNRSTVKGGVSQSDIQRRLGFEVRHTIPDDQPLATHSINRGVPLVMSHQRSAVARAIRSLAQQLVQDAAGATEPAGRDEMGLLQRWLQSFRLPFSKSADSSAEWIESR